MYTVLYPINELKIGGAELQLLELVRGLDKRRFRPIVAPLYRGGVLEDDFRAVPGVEIAHLNRRRRFDPSPTWGVLGLLRARRVDVVQPFLSPATFFGLLPALLVGTPVIVVTERCGIRRFRGIGYRAYQAAEDVLSHLADVIIPDSLAGRQLLLERGLPDRKIRVIRNGLNEERLRVDWTAVRAIRAQLGVSTGEQVVGILASLTPAKGHDLLLRALATLRVRRPGLRCAIIGDGPLRTQLESLVAQLSLADRVVFFGQQQRVADYLSACDLLVSASRDNEGCSNSILEAMGLGVPVVATDIGGNRELVEHRITGYLTPKDDWTGLAESVEFAFANASETATTAARAWEMVRARFGLTRMVAEYEALYDGFLASRRHAGWRGTLSRAF